GGRARLRPQTGGEAADRGLAPAQAGPLRDDALCLPDRAGRVLAEVLFQRGAVAVQGAALAFPGVAADGVQPAGQERAEVALDGGAGGASEAGRVGVGPEPGTGA